MSDIMTTPWLDKVRRYRELYCAYLERVREPVVAPAATDADIAVMKRDAAQRGLRVDPEYVTFLRIINGTCYGFFMNGANLPHEDLGPSDFIRDNDAPWHDDPKTTRYGTSDIDIYQFNEKSNRFEVIDNGGGDVMESYATFGELADYAISKVLARLEPPSYSPN